MTSKTIKVDLVARVEGEGALTVRFSGRQLAAVELRIFEPPRFFEGLLRGRAQSEAPDITARICGICPVAYQMSACHAIEDAHGVVLGPALRALRRLLYCGEWIESHVLHMVMLHAPDFLGLPDAVAIARLHPEPVKRALRMKKAGNAILRAVGGREVHPINVRVGGFYRAPTREELAPLLPELRWGRKAARELLDFCAGFRFPEVHRDYELVALHHPQVYPLCEGRIRSSRGLDIGMNEYDAHFVEDQVSHSTALHSSIRGAGHYLCGPLARFHLNFDRLPHSAREAAAAVGIEPPSVNPYKSLLVRGVEVLFAFDEAVRLIEAYERPDPPFVDVPAGPGTGRACTEAPRGLLYHRYRIDEAGLIAEATIVPPTSQNQGVIEDDLRAIAPEFLDLPLEEAKLRAEFAIRNFDPCISCATHFLTLRVEQEAP
jgi:coenzyme F420-reducing hydrogenase alpha subunit